MQRKKGYISRGERYVIGYANTYLTNPYKPYVPASVCLHSYLKAKGKRFFNLAGFVTTNPAVHPFVRAKAKSVYPQGSSKHDNANRESPPIDFIFDHATLINGLPASVCILEQGE